MELHGGGEVKEEVGEVWALGGQFVQHGVGDHVHRHLQVAQRRAEPCAAQTTATPRRDGGKGRGVEVKMMRRCEVFSVRGLDEGGAMGSKTYGTALFVMLVFSVLTTKFVSGNDTKRIIRGGIFSLTFNTKWNLQGIQPT